MAYLLFFFEKKKKKENAYNSPAMLCPNNGLQTFIARKISADTSIPNDLSTYFNIGAIFLATGYKPETFSVLINIV